ncbi:cytochrome c biogenesis protein CcdA [Corynebacterium phocae]|uniref:redoxin domain-containing protein n=1 Tax=Corynebacterium phocae TaxID=161895 RepID=UPI0009FD7B3E|nr:cytochrome c biogenesis protein CcdA [Corynebacterium phocae]KAA8728656.1 redoxin domain-containing protein [Corynebacterium phocae]
MFSMILIGLVGGVLTSLSPCILPVLPLILAVSSGDKRRPYLVVAGLVVSFAALTLVGSLALNALGLPGSTVKWVGIGLLIAVGLGMLVPKLGEWLQAPFDKVPKPYFLQNKVRDRGGFAVGLVLGAVYVPCAGPVLAAITVAAATGEIDARIFGLTLSFAVGAALPLLAFAVGGNKVGQRVDWFQSNQGIIRRVSGVIVILLAIALAFDAPAAIQRSLPDWTSSAQRSLGDKVIIGDGDLETCRREEDATKANDCGKLPELAGLENWFNTDQPVDPLTSGNVTLVDFWAYACINCQRANEHVTKLYDNYKDYGLDVIGIHAPEYSFEEDLANVKKAAQDTGINYPVVQDNNFVTWKNFNNRYWPAHYLTDHNGTVVQIHEGEGKYAETETLVRQLLKERDPNVELPAPVEKDVTDQPREPRNPETYLGAQRSRYQANPVRGQSIGMVDYGPGTPPSLGQYSLAGKWDIGEMSIKPQPGASLQLNYQAKWVQLVVSGKGTIKLTHEDGSVETFDITNPGSVDLIRVENNHQELITIEPDAGLELYSFTFG